MIPAPTPARLTPLQRIALVLGSTIVVAVFGALALWGAAREQRSRSAVDACHRTVESLQRLLTRLVEAEAGQRGYLLTGHQRFRRQYLAARDEARRELVWLRAHEGAPDARARLDTLGDVMEGRFAELARTVAARDAQPSARAPAGDVDRGLLTLGEARRLTGAVQQAALAGLAARSAREDRRSQLLFVILGLGTAAAVLVSLFLNRWMVANTVVQEAFAASLGRANTELQEQQVELEVQQEQLMEQSAELQAQNGQLEQLAEALEQRTADAERANEARAGFLAAVSHDVRTPLNAIVGYADLLELEIHGPLNPTQKRDVAAVHSSARRLLGLFNDMLSFARIQAGKVPIRPTAVPLARLCRELEASIRPQVAARGLAYACEGCGAALLAEADEERVVQVLLNLLTNAIKFTEPGGRVAVSCAQDEQRVVVRVRDTGRGIAAEKLPLIFEPYVQLPDAGKGDAPARHGVGLGLAISRELTRAMGGELTVESTPGRGSCFSLFLPRARPGFSAAPPDGRELRIPLPESGI